VKPKEKEEGLPGRIRWQPFFLHVRCLEMGKRGRQQLSNSQNCDMFPDRIVFDQT
jgi:hypothetical protein